MNTNDDELKGHDTPSGDGEKKKMEIEITRYKKLVGTFNHPRALAKLIVVVSMIIVLVFIGISIVALVIKGYYPYKVVNSNEYGATIIDNEDNEVIYWLFNTADLWANSGIHVKQGDVISVRASGAFHSSIHHLVKDAETNQNGRNWLNPVGGHNSAKPTPREESRANYRISEAHPFNTLLMQVIPDDVVLKSSEGKWSIKNACYLDGRDNEVKNNNNTINNDRSVYPDIYAIGAERDMVTIRTDGVLHFAVNDIALTRRIIMEMMKEVYIKETTNKENKQEFKDTKKLEMGQFAIPYDDIDTITEMNRKALIDGLEELGFHGKESDIMKLGFEFKVKDEWNSAYRDLYNVLIDKSKKEDASFFQKNFTELDYYLICGFVDAWFVDNVGSYLIVIERKKQ